MLLAKISLSSSRQLRGDCKYHPDALEPVHGGKYAAAVDPGDL